HSGRLRELKGSAWSVEPDTGVIGKIGPIGRDSPAPPARKAPIPPPALSRIWPMTRSQIHAGLLALLAVLTVACPGRADWQTPTLNATVTPQVGGTFLYQYNLTNNATGGGEGLWSFILTG